MPKRCASNQIKPSKQEKCLDPRNVQRDDKTTDASDDNIVVTIITANGDYFTSGNDMKRAMDKTRDPIEQASAFGEVVDAFILYPKPLIAVVNGPAIGVGATLATMCDVAFVS
nr:unnamed protein product [Callosobruchus analis]